MALAHGADLVIELPVLFSCHNAGVFAAGAVDILAATGVITHISFGMEDPAGADKAILDILLHEPDPFKANLAENMKKGFSYAESRSLAAESLYPGTRNILSKPNNTLAFSYLLRIREKNYNIEPLPIQRIGGAYHSIETGILPSATAIRRELRKRRFRILEKLPPESSLLIERDISDGRCLLSDVFYWRIMRSVLLRLEAEEIRTFAEISEGIEHKILETAKRASSIEDLVSSCISRRYTRGRIQRHLVHILLGLRHTKNREAQRKGPPYLRILGMNGTGKKLLRKMKETARLPVYFHHKDFRESREKTLADLEYRACGIWENLVDSPQPTRERVMPPVIVDL